MKFNQELHRRSVTSKSVMGLVGQGHQYQRCVDVCQDSRKRNYQEDQHDGNARDDVPEIHGVPLEEGAQCVQAAVEETRVGTQKS